MFLHTWSFIWFSLKENVCFCIITKVAQFWGLRFNDNGILFFVYYVSCPKRKLTFMALYNFFSFVDFSTICRFSISHLFLFCQLFTQATFTGNSLFSLSIFHLICTVSDKVSDSFFFLIMSPRSFNWLFLTLIVRFASMSATKKFYGKRGECLITIKAPIIQKY